MNKELFEIVMLLCFGAAWPFSIYRSLRSKDLSGKSVVFLYIIVLGYISGIIHKVINDMDYVISFYILNIIMVSADISIYHYKKNIKYHDS